MNILLYHIKGLFTVLNLLLFLLLLGYLAARFQKTRLSKRLIITTLFLFLLSSTTYLPQFLATRMENKYLPFNPVSIKGKQDKIYIHVLGSGYSLDKRLPATTQLATAAKGRLMEAMRLYNQLNNPILVCSGSALFEPETQAVIVKKAAILLGADSSRILTLDTPTTTQEEAEALAHAIGTNSSIIIVTDALHMPRACKFFAEEGFKPFASPTNYNVPRSENNLGLKWWPALGNMQLMDMVLHEYLGTLKGKL